MCVSVLACLLAVLFACPGQGHAPLLSPGVLVDLAAASPGDRLRRSGPVSGRVAARCFSAAARELGLQTCANWVRRRVQPRFEVSSNWVCFSSGFGTLPIDADAYRYGSIVTV